MPAVAPLVTKLKSPFKRAIATAWGKPRLPAANIVIMFENPGFAPGGRNGRGGISPSRKLRAIANAQRIAVSAVL